MDVRKVDPNHPMYRFMSVVPKSARIAAASFTVLMGVFSWVFYVGFYRWIAEAQLAMFSQFEMHITIILNFLGYLVSFSLAARLMVTLKVLPRATEEEAAKYFEGIAKRPDQRLRPKAVVWIVLPWSIVGLVAGLYAKHGAAAQTPTVYTMEQLDSGQKPDGIYLQVTGEVVKDSHFEYGDPNHPDCYTPLLTPNWDKSKPLLVVIRSPTPMNPGVNTFKGMRWPLGVPGPVRAMFERVGVDAEEAACLEPADTPSDWDSAGTLMLVGGAVGLVISGVAGFFAFRKRGEVAAAVQVYAAPPAEDLQSRR